jgi:intergrase/recombinase
MILILKVKNSGISVYVPSSNYFNKNSQSIKEHSLYITFVYRIMYKYTLYLIIIT